LRPVRKRKLVDEMRTTWKVSVRKACRVLRFDPKSYRYRSRRPGQAPLESRIKEICQTRVRYGYRRVHVMLRREGWVINEKKTRRVYNEMGMQLRNKTPKRRVKAALRADRTPPSRSNEVWAMDFVHDRRCRAGKAGQQRTCAENPIFSQS
jgi:putative transposase